MEKKTRGGQVTRRLEGKVALVTGAASGIGRATAIAFAQEGAKVVLADVVATAGEDVVGVIKESGGDAILVKCDVSRAAEVESMVDEAVETYGRLDCAFNNAGVEGDVARVAQCTEENWDRVIDVNLKGVWLCMKYEIPQMLQRGSGAIVNMSSVSGFPHDRAHSRSPTRVELAKSRKRAPGGTNRRAGRGRRGRPVAMFGRRLVCHRPSPRPGRRPCCSVAV